MKRNSFKKAEKPVPAIKNINNQVFKCNYALSTCILGAFECKLLYVNEAPIYVT